MTGLDKEGKVKVLLLEPKDIDCGMLHYREQGVKCARLGLFDRGLKDLDTAFEIDSELWRTVVMRARAALKASRFQEAYDDANMALNADAEDIDALLIQARALYNLGEFEKALMIAHRGWNKRKMPPNFAEIIFTAEETIEDCIGRNVGPIMLEFLDLIYEMEKEREEEELLESKRRGDPCLFDDDSEGDDEGGNREQRHCLERLQNYMCGKYLQRLCADRRFLDRINTPSAIVGPTQKTIDAVLELVREGIEFLQKMQEMLRERMPLYSIRFRELVHSESARKRRRQMQNKRKEVVRATALSQLEKLRQARIEKNFQKFYYTTERCYEFLSRQTKHVLPRKRDFLDGLYNLVGIGLLDMTTFSKDDSEEHRKLRAQMTVGVPTPHGAVDRVIANALNPCIDIKRRLEVDEKRVKGSDSHLERAWVFCDMCYQNVEARRFDMVRFYGRKCITEARAVEHWAWCINALILIAKSEMLQNNRAEAVHALTEGMEFGTKLRDEDVLELLQTCIDVINEAPPDTVPEPRKAREKKIIDMMKGDVWVDQAKVLLQCIVERERLRIAKSKRTQKEKTTPKPKKEKKEKTEEDEVLQLSRPSKDKKDESA